MRILALAYACEPDKGSEPAAGWAWARMLARIGDVVVITRANNRSAIESALADVPERETMRFVYVDLPSGLSRWKRGQRGIRLYYILWQLAALRAARREVRERPVDLIWHLTLANAWLGSVGGMIGPPFVFGPVGGGVTVDRRLYPALGVRGVTDEVVRRFARFVARALNPLARSAWRSAELILVQNPETLRWLPRGHRSRAVVFPHTVVEHPLGEAPPTDRLAVFVARLMPWKGGSLAIRALRHAPGWRLAMIGAGRDERRLRRLAARLGLENRVEFVGWLPRTEAGKCLAKAAVLLFPTMHDDAPFVVAEARSAGVPVIALDRGGPPILGARTVPINAVGHTARALAEALETASSEPRVPDHRFSLDQRTLDLQALLAGSSSVAGGPPIGEAA